MAQFCSGLHVLLICSMNKVLHSSLAECCGKLCRYVTGFYIWWARQAIHASRDYLMWTIVPVPLSTCVFGSREETTTRSTPTLGPSAMKSPVRRTHGSCVSSFSSHDGDDADLLSPRDPVCPTDVFLYLWISGIRFNYKNERRLWRHGGGRGKTCGCVCGS